jgi:hypothetical protein
MALFNVGWVAELWKRTDKVTCLQGRLRLHLLDHNVCKRLVKLERNVILMTFRAGVSLEHLLQNLHCELGSDRSAGDELIKGVGEGHSDAKQPRRLLQRHG